MPDRNKDALGDLGALLPPAARLKTGRAARRASAIDAAIVNKMRAMYDDLVHQPIPDRFVELLKQIDQAREKKSP